MSGHSQKPLGHRYDHRHTHHNNQLRPHVRQPPQLPEPVPAAPNYTSYVMFILCSLFLLLPLYFFISILIITVATTCGADTAAGRATTGSVQAYATEESKHSSLARYPQQPFSTAPLQAVPSREDHLSPPNQRRTAKSTTSVRQSHSSVFGNSIH